MTVISWLFVNLWRRKHRSEQIRPWCPFLLVVEPLWGSPDTPGSLHPRIRRWDSSRGRRQSCSYFQRACTWDWVWVVGRSPLRARAGVQSPRPLASRTWSVRRKERVPTSDRALQWRSEWTRNTIPESLQYTSVYVYVYVILDHLDSGCAFPLLQFILVILYW